MKLTFLHFILCFTWVSLLCAQDNPAPPVNSKKTITIITRTMDENGNVQEERTTRPLTREDEANIHLDSGDKKKESSKRIIIRKDGRVESNDEDIIINMPDLEELQEDIKDGLKDLDIELDDLKLEKSQGAFLGVIPEYGHDDADSQRDGVEIEDVIDGSAADKAGLKEDDIILSVDGVKIKDGNHLVEVIRSHQPGDKVKIQYERNKKVDTKEVELSKYKPMQIHKFHMPGPGFHGRTFNSWPHVKPFMYNLKPKNSDCEKKAFLGISYVETETGLLITNITEDGPASKSGLQVGDFIEKFEGTKTTKGKHLRDELKSQKPGNSVRIDYRHEGSRKTLTMQLGNTCKSTTFNSEDIEMDDRSGSIAFKQDGDEILEVYPNPAEGQVNISFNSNSSAPIKLVVTDVQGKEIFNEEIKDNKGKITRTIPLSKDYNGAIIVHATQDGLLLTKKVIQKSN